MMYWIRDEDDTPQGFPLRKLMQLIIQKIEPAPFEFWILRSQGYGATICEWNGVLDTQDRILADITHLLEISIGTEQWFFDLDIEVVTNDVKFRFGLHDSTALFIDAPDEFVNSITNTFEFVTSRK